MNTIPLNNGSYTDFTDLSALRRDAKENSAGALEKAAQQFEALFLQMMLKSMRDAGGDGEGGLFDNEHTRLYQDMFDKQLSLNLSQADNGIGLAKILVQQLKASMPELQQNNEASASVSRPEGYSVPSRGVQHFQMKSPSPLNESDNALSNNMPVEAGTAFTSPEEFVTAMWPHAQRAADTLGVDPRAILAQAALETGWGKSIIRQPDGNSSHNLFNIKADHRWNGDQVNKLTLEYRDGIAVKEQAAFRAYGSFAESFDDYVRFLQNNGRYQQALESGPDIALFTQRLQQAGYATDPAYASKIQRIVNSDVLAEFKNDGNKTLI